MPQSSSRWKLVDRLLLRLAPSLQLQVRPAEGGHHRYWIEMDGREWQALTLVRSSDYWRQRLHLQPAGRLLQLIVCERHDSILPLEVLDLTAGRLYDRYTAPLWFEQGRRQRVAGTGMIVLGGLLCGLHEWHEALERFPPSTRRRYRAELRRLMKRRPGRPLTLS
ncbi:MAG: hypothetical protein IRZ31_20390 [Thermogemmatispora sp.]|uniref:hypothetical protein n=1 Tax=Thermogemmatispora sp. TaxID=1968838 RepID=UPI002605E1B5|nr:hypothetical protein [Thermogemmatispora sp.]MBX5459259.1 hypothetical protein [Thermogemmatispora sp.]